MKKKSFEIFTCTEHESIPENMFLIKNEHGWLFLTHDQSNWYVNHTNSFKNCTEEENDNAIREIIKTAVKNMEEAEKHE